MPKNIINLLPREIIYLWINKHNSQVCKLWYSIWCTKPMIVRFPDGRTLWYANLNLKIL